MIPADSASGAGDWFVRPARPADWAAACAVAAASMRDIPPFLATEAAFDQAVANGGIYVATTSGRVIGILGVQPIAYDGEKPYTLWVELIAVHPAWQRQGVGTALYLALGRWADELGVQGALTARADDPVANALHRQVGFVTHRDDLLLWRFDSDTC